MMDKPKLSANQILGLALQVSAYIVGLGQIALAITGHWDSTIPGLLPNSFWAFFRFGDLWYLGGALQIFMMWLPAFGLYHLGKQIKE